MEKQKSRKWLWIVGVVVIFVGLAAGATVILAQAGLRPPGSQPQSIGDDVTTVQIRAASAVESATQASGSIVFGAEKPIVIEVDGTVTDLPIAVGDMVETGDLLVGVDTVTLERAVTRARLDVQTSQNQLDQLMDPASTEDIADAEANLASAKANLADVEAGATDAELAAARASLAAAQAKYGDVTADLSADEQTKLKASLEKARVNMEKAQRDYDEIKWRGDVGATPESAALQTATIEYEAAKADYAVAAEPASDAEVQSSVSSIRDAQERLADLQAQPKPNELASAEAQVASAQSKLDTLRNGASQLEITASELQLQQALVALEEALTNLQEAQVKADSPGVVTSTEVEVGESVRSGQVVVMLANPADLEAEVLVAEVDVATLAVDQRAEISLDALPERTFSGSVLRIAPKSEPGQSAVNYLVEVALNDADLNGVRPGMTAVATFEATQRDQAATDGAWLVPGNAIQQTDGVSTVRVVRAGAPFTAVVTPGAVQGDWRLVTSQELTSGDEVIGSVSTYLSSDVEAMIGPGGPGGPGAAARNP
ncbi:MAG: HlyD family efflux transporter periplasmic adaptor subunit [Anaerolineales bacterium]|nr:HlyD family efflux transporter periplasmic adaptor subunit [Anaerolineales bacterium]